MEDGGDKETLIKVFRWLSDNAAVDYVKNNSDTTATDDDLFIDSEIDTFV